MLIKSSVLRSLALPAVFLGGGAVGYLIGYQTVRVNVLYETGIVTRTDALPRPVSFEPSAMMEFSPTAMLRGRKFDLDFEVISVVERVPGDTSPFLKKATVATNMPGYSTWVLYSDEGDPKGKNLQKAPNPLNYFTAGASLCLMKQINGAETALGIELEDVRVEQRIKYSQDDLMTRNAMGRTESVETNILIKSDLPRGMLKELTNLSLQSCLTGEALKNKTDLATKLFVNGEEMK